MEVLEITLFFFAIVAGGAILSWSLLNRAMARDRAYMLAAGELELAAAPSIEQEPPSAWLALDPVGTLALMLVYLMVLIGLWLAMYAILLARV